MTSDRKSKRCIYRHYLVNMSASCVDYHAPVLKQMWHWVELFVDLHQENDTCFDF